MFCIYGMSSFKNFKSAAIIALEDDEDHVRIRGDDRFQGEALRKRLHLIRDVHCPQILEDAGGEMILRPLGSHRGECAPGPYEEDAWLGWMQCCPFHRRGDRFGLPFTECGEEIVPPCDRSEDPECGEEFPEAVLADEEHSDAQVIEKRLEPEMAYGIDGAEHEIGLGGNEYLRIDAAAGCIVHEDRIRRSESPFDRFCDSDADRASGKLPDIRERGIEACRPHRECRGKACT